VILVCRPEDQAVIVELVDRLGYLPPPTVRTSTLVEHGKVLMLSEEAVDGVGGMADAP
jgi:hypothetical protein